MSTHTGLAHISEKPQTLKNIRINHNISVNDLAYESGVSRHAVLRMEQLCYGTPLPNIIEGLSAITGIAEGILTEAYLTDVRLNRLFSANTYFAHRGMLNEAIESINMEHLGASGSFQGWRELVFGWQHYPQSRIYFCSAVSVHPATLLKYESFKSGFPAPLEVALTQCNVSDNVLEYFKADNTKAD